MAAAKADVVDAAAAEALLRVLGLYALPPSEAAPRGGRAGGDAAAAALAALVAPHRRLCEGGPSSGVKGTDGAAAANADADSVDAAAAGASRSRLLR